MGLKPQRLLFILFNLFLLTTLVYGAENDTGKDAELADPKENVSNEMVSEIIDDKKEETVIKDDTYVGQTQEEAKQEMEAVPVDVPDVKPAPAALPDVEPAPVEADTDKALGAGRSLKAEPRSGAYVMDPAVMPARLENDFELLDGRRAPPVSYNNNGQPYIISESRLKTIRERFLYPFYDQGGDEDIGDYQKDIHSSTPQIHKNFNFQLPFFGFRFNYTRVSMHGYLEFSDPPSHFTYPLTFPVKDWPKENDPSFIGIFYSKCRIGAVRDDDVDQRKAGVYFRMERDLQTRTDPMGVEIRERLTWDLRTGVIGADTFVPKHAAIVTWKNMSFAGGIDNSLYKTNSFQLVLATDEVYTYAIFNYLDLQWSSHTEAGGDTTGGEGGTPAYIGFNAGNGTQSYEYKPYSQASILRDLTGRGWGNNFPGRHIFRIDEKILVGSCNKDIDAANLPLMFAPESGNMLGGTIVNVTGPCFTSTDRVTCRFDTEDVVGQYQGRNIFTCVQPPLMAEGYVRFEIAVNTENYKWKGRYFVETPATATERVFFTTNDVHEKYPSEIKITWDKYNLTINQQENIMISLWGYRETTIRPEFQYINYIELNAQNNGEYVIAPGNFRMRDDILTNDMQFGFIQINLTQTGQNHLSPVLWSKPIPLGWYFAPQWERIYGNKWPEKMCNNWLRSDRFLKNFAAQLPLCPCTLQQALLDKGRFMPDFDCDKDANPKCFYNKGAMHCVKTGNPSEEGAGQQCCYDKNDYLMLSYDQQWGSRPQRSHNLGFLPWNEANKVPTLSNWYHDQSPFYLCCLWQEEQAVGCETYRFERRPSQDCVSYQPPGVAAVFGDPHMVTFDDNRYTFNGKGEFVLVRTDVPNLKLDVQGRFEQMPPNIHGPVMATQLTSIAAAGNNSATIEVRLRPSHAQWRYRLDVFANGKRVFFDRKSLKVQHFPGVTVYTPTYILNQSEVVMMFQSGAGVEVIENQGFMSARIYLPWVYINKTRGLLGNWSWDINDDFVRPDGTSVPLNTNDLQNIHNEFGKYWMLTDRAVDGLGSALFTREFGRTASYYTNETFLPNFVREPRDFVPANRTLEINRATELCGLSYQCRYDYAMTLNRDLAHFTKNYYDSIVNIKEMNSKRIISCGVLETPRFGRKSNFFFVPDTKVTFECNKNFVLIGDQRRTCLPNGQWDVPEYGYTECLRNQEYSSRQAGMTFGIILIVILPILFVLACAWYYCVKKRRDGDKVPFMEKLDSRSRSNSRANLRAASLGNLTDSYKSDPYQNPYMRQQSEPHLTREDSDPIKKMESFKPEEGPVQIKSTFTSPPQEDRESSFQGDDDDIDDIKRGALDRNDSPKASLSPQFSLPKSKRNYDNTYRTHEPLVGHPNSEFPAKPWDLSEADVLSSGSNDGSDLTNDTLTKPANDIAFISAKTKPKQYGRRRMKKPIEDSGISSQGSGPLIVNYNAKYDDQDSTFSSQYSPTGSDAYSPQTSPVYGTINPKPVYYPNNMSSVPEEPQPKLSTFAFPIKKGKSTDALKETKPAPPDPLAQGELKTFSSRTTMV